MPINAKQLLESPPSAEEVERSTESLKQLDESAKTRWSYFAQQIEEMYKTEIYRFAQQPILADKRWQPGYSPVPLQLRQSSPQTKYVYVFIDDLPGLN